MSDLIIVFIPDSDAYEILKTHLQRLAVFEYFDSRKRHPGLVYNYPRNLISIGVHEDTSTVQCEYDAHGLMVYKLSIEFIKELLLLPCIPSIMTHIKQACYGYYENV